MRIEPDVKLDFKDVLIRPKRSTLASRAEVCLSRKFTFKHSKQEWNGIPVMASNMDTIGNFEMASTLAEFDMMTVISKYNLLDDWVTFKSNHPQVDLKQRVAISTGVADDDGAKLEEILDKVDVQMICMDVANGYSEKFVDAVRHNREKYPGHTIMAGNVVTGEMTEELILTGADIVKVGIGPGSVCTTRIKTGVGYPQLSAIIECADAAHGLKGLIIADGGCVCSGDAAKAFGGGADFVMLGAMLSGHDESGGRIVERNGKKFKEFYGMSSKVAMERHHQGVASYRAAEGKSVIVPYRGSVRNTAQDILGGLRSACTYVGAPALKELTKRTTFVMVSQQANTSLNYLEPI